MSTSISCSRNMEHARTSIEARETTLEHLPTESTIEVSSRCNYACIMCPNSRRPEGEAGYLLSEALFEKTKPLMESSSQIQLFGNGEPLLSPVLWQGADYIASLPDGGRQVHINSNGSLLDAHASRRLLDKGFTRVNFSIDACTPETYRKIRNQDFDRVCSNIRQLLDLRERHGNSTLEVFINMTVMRENIEELPDFMDFACDLGVDGVFFWPLNEFTDPKFDDWTATRGDFTFFYRQQQLYFYPNLANACLDRALDRARELGLAVETDVKRGYPNHAGVADLPYPMPIETFRSRARRYADTYGNLYEPEPQVAEGALYCTYPWTWALVMANGDVRPCCYEIDPVGNLNEDDFDSIWNGPVMHDIRSNIVHGNVAGHCTTSFCRYSLAAQKMESSPFLP